MPVESSDVNRSSNVMLYPCIDHLNSVAKKVYYPPHCTRCSMIDADATDPAAFKATEHCQLKKVDDLIPTE